MNAILIIFFSTLAQAAYFVQVRQTILEAQPTGFCASDIPAAIKTLVQQGKAARVTSAHLKVYSNTDIHGWSDEDPYPGVSFECVDAYGIYVVDDSVPVSSLLLIDGVSQLAITSIHDVVDAWYPQDRLIKENGKVIKTRRKRFSLDTIRDKGPSAFKKRRRI